MIARSTGWKRSLGSTALLLLCLSVAVWGQTPGQDRPRTAAEPSITITLVPPAGGGPGHREAIAGKVHGQDVTGFRVGLFSRTDRWYVQPFVAAPYTHINADGTWATRVHLGAHYAALLVEPSYKPPATTFALPELGAGVIARTSVAAR